MGDNDDMRTHPKPACYKCKGPTRFYASVLDPQSGKSYSLFECGECEVVTSQVVELVNVYRLLKHPVAENSGASFPPARKLDDPFRDHLTLDRSISQMKCLANVIKRHRHRLDVIRIERAASQKWGNSHRQLPKAQGPRCMYNSTFRRDLQVVNRYIPVRTLVTPHKQLRSELSPAEAFGPSGAGD